MNKWREGEIDLWNSSNREINLKNIFKFYFNEQNEDSKDNLVIYDIDNKLFSIYGNLVNELSHSKNNSIILNINEALRFVSKSDVEDKKKDWEESILSSKKIETEIRLDESHGYQRWLSLKLKKYTKDDYKGKAYYGYIHDITKEKNAEEQLKDLNKFDIVTKLPNKYYVKSEVDKYLASEEKEKLRGALLLINIDNFKIINESFEHEFGDLLLYEIAKSLLKVVGDTDLVCRYSGDEFIVFKSNMESVKDSENFVVQIKNIFDRPFIINNKSLYITVSIGVALFPENGHNFSILLKNADSAMHRAKSNGKDEWEFFNNNISTELSRMYEIQRGLRTALAENEFYVLFQPKVLLNDSTVNGFEALIRWKSKELGIVSPTEFIPIAENTRLILPIGKFVLEEVFKKVKMLLDEGYDNFKIAVNFSEVQLRYGMIVKDFHEFINKYEVPPKYIEVEITESMLMKTFDENVHRLQLIKDLGVSIALDDFGTGYSSLNYLTRLPIDVLKIDRSFVVDLLKNNKSRCIVGNIIQLSHQLGIDVVAEGVEEFEQVDYLKEILCDVVQGYYFSKPELFENIKNLLGKKI